MGAEFGGLVAKAYKARKKLVAAIKNTIERVEKLDRAEKAASHTGSALVLAGSVVSVGGGITLMVVTGGIAATVVVPALLWGGTAIGVGGGVTKITGTLVCRSKVKSAIEKLVKLAKKDAESNDALMKLERTMKKGVDNFNESLRKLHVDPAIAEFVTKCGEADNLDDLWKLIKKELPPLESILKYAMSYNNNSQIVKILLQVVTCSKKLVASTSATTSSTSTSATASSTASASTSAATSTSTSTTASSAASTVASASTEVVDDAAVIVVKETATGTARTAAMVAGGVMVGIGVAVAGWEIYQIVKKTKEKCKIAVELKDIAKDLEEGIPAPSS